MSVLYWKQRVRVTVAEFSYATAIAFNNEAISSGRAHLDFEAPDLDIQAGRLLSAVMVKHATRGIETRDTPDGKWKPLKLGESRVVEVTEGEFVTLTFTLDLQTAIDMLDALPVTLAGAWVAAAEKANEGVSAVPFLSWLNLQTTSATDGESKSDNSPSKERPPRRQRTKTTGQGNTTPPSSPDTLPSQED